MRLLLVVLLTISALAQVPIDTLQTRLGVRETPRSRFLADNPDAIETVRLPEATHFRKANGQRVALVGRGQNWIDANNQIQPIAPELWATSTGFRETGSPVVVRVVTGRTTDSIETYDAVTGKVVTITSNKLTRTGAWTFTFAWENLNWTLEVQPFGWTVESQQVTAARGVHTYQMPLASSGFNPQLEVATGDLVDGSLRLTRAIMVGANGTHYPCSAWSVTSKYIAYTCDDTTLPVAAYPYVIDPSLNAYGATATDDGDLVKSVITGSACGNLTGSADSTSTGATTQLSRTDNLDGFFTCTDKRTMWRFDTGSIPSTATVTAASWSCYSCYKQNTSNSAHGTVKAYYRNSIWPRDVTDFAVDTGATLAYSVAFLSWPGTYGNRGSVSLSNVTSIAKGTGNYTGLWMYIDMGGTTYTTASGDSMDSIAAYNANSSGSTNDPYLVITYSISGPKLLVVSQ